MKVFISWSGEASEAAAKALRDWLPDVIQGVKPWLSASDIEAGARWSRNVETALQESRFGILCVTNANQASPWLLFEAGALAKSIDDTFVCPYLLDLVPSDLAAGPLTSFQAKTATEQGTLDLIRSLNRALKENALPSEQLERSFQRWWPDLKTTLETLPATTPPAKRSQDEVVNEILLSVRELLGRARDGDLRSASEAQWAALGVTPYRPPTPEAIAIFQGFRRLEGLIGEIGGRQSNASDVKADPCRYPNIEAKVSASVTPNSAQEPTRGRSVGPPAEPAT